MLLCLVSVSSSVLVLSQPSDVRNQVSPDLVLAYSLSRCSPHHIHCLSQACVRSGRYNTPSAGHPGIGNTYQLTKHDFWWPNMKQDVEQYVKGCAPCQANKINTHPLKPTLFPITPVEGLPFRTIAIVMCRRHVQLDLSWSLVAVAMTFLKVGKVLTESVGNLEWMRIPWSAIVSLRDGSGGLGPSGLGDK